MVKQLELESRSLLGPGHWAAQSAARHTCRQLGQHLIWRRPGVSPLAARYVFTRAMEGKSQRARGSRRVLTDMGGCQTGCHTHTDTDPEARGHGRELRTWLRPLPEQRKVGREIGREWVLNPPSAHHPNQETLTQLAACPGLTARPETGIPSSLPLMAGAAKAHHR